MLKMILIGALGLFIGYKFNQFANMQSEKRIIDTLTAKIEELINKAKTGRLTSDEATNLNGLQEALTILKNKNV